VETDAGRESPTLVTGGSGFVGRHLVARWPGPVVAWQRHAPATDDSAGHVRWESVDLTDGPHVVDRIGTLRPSRIVHLAGAPSVRTSWQSPVPHLCTNVMGTHHLLDAVRRSGHDCRTLIVSSAQVYQAGDAPLDEDATLRPPSPYGLSKLAQEQLALRAAHEDGLDVVVARPFNHIGPGQAPEFAISSFARQIARIEAGLQPPTLRVGNLEARRDTSDVRDVVEAYRALMERGERGGIYNVCSGRAPRMRDLLDGLLELSRSEERRVGKEC